MIGERDPEKVSKALFGLKDREYYFRYKKQELETGEIDEIILTRRRLQGGTER